MAKLDKIQKCVDKRKESALIKLAHDKDKEVRLAAIAGMGKIGRDDSMNDLIGMLHDADADIRAACATALGEIKNDHAEAHIQYQLGKEQDEKAQQAMKNALVMLRESSH